MTLIHAKDLHGSQHNGIVYHGVISEAEWGTSPRGTDWGKFTLLSRTGREDRNGNLLYTRYVILVPGHQVAEFQKAYPKHDRSQWTDWKEQRKIAPENRHEAAVYFGETGSQYAEASGTPYKGRDGRMAMWTDIVVRPERVDLNPQDTPRKRLPAVKK